MDQITSSPRSVEDSSSWKHAHQRLSLMLAESLDHTAPPQTFIGGVNYVGASGQGNERKLVRSRAAG